MLRSSEPAAPWIEVILLVLILISLWVLLWPGSVQAAEINPRQKAQNALTQDPAPVGTERIACPTAAPVVCQKDKTAPPECCTETEVCCGNRFGNGCCAEGAYCDESRVGRPGCTKCPTGRRFGLLRCGGDDCCPSNMVCAYWKGPSGTCITKEQCRAANPAVGASGETADCGSWCCRPGTPTSPASYCETFLGRPSYTACWPFHR